MIQLVGADARTVPEWFTRRLRDIDPALVCYFNSFKGAFMIDRHARDEHGNQTQTNVMTMPAISERFLEELKGMDAWTKFGSLENLRRDHENKKADFDAKAEQSIKDDMHHAALDNRRQMNEALTLVQRHNLHTPPQ
jgi:hypothetical protein